jgi:hypothetical protein
MTSPVTETGGRVLRPSGVVKQFRIILSYEKGLARIPGFGQ